MEKEKKSTFTHFKLNFPMLSVLSKRSLSLIPQPSLMRFLQGERINVLSHFLFFLSASTLHFLKFIKTLAWAHSSPQHYTF